VRTMGSLMTFYVLGEGSLEMLSIPGIQGYCNLQLKPKLCFIKQ